MRFYQLELTTESSGTCCAAVCGDITIKIKNRTRITFPSTLPSSIVQTNEILQEPKWNEFCDLIDEALIPLSNIRRRNAQASLGFLFFVLVFLACIPFVLGGLWMPTETVDDGGDSSSSSSNSSSNGADGRQYITMVFGLLFVLPFAGICYIANTSKRRNAEVDAKLERICREANCSNSNSSSSNNGDNDNDNPTLANPDIRFVLRHQLQREKEGGGGVVRYIQVVIVSTDYSMMERGERMMIRRPRTPDTVCSEISGGE